MKNYTVHNGYKAEYSMSWTEDSKWAASLSFSNKEGSTTTYHTAAFSQEAAIKRINEAWAAFVAGGMVGEQYRENSGFETAIKWDYELTCKNSWCHSNRIERTPNADGGMVITCLSCGNTIISGDQHV